MASLIPPRWGLALLTVLAGCATTRPAAEPAPEGGVLVICPGPAKEAYALGNFNAWSAEAPLPRQADGSFAGRVALPAGLTLVACELVLEDGSRIHRPPANSQRLVDDGFGGQDGAFEVPEPGAPNP